jgi:predicted transcriptional regulator
MARDFGVPTTIRMKTEVRDQVRVIADREGNTEAAVLRRALATGLQEIARQQQSEGRERF